MRFVLDCLVLCCLVWPLASFGQSATEATLPPVDVATTKVAPVLGEWSYKAIARAYSVARYAELSSEVRANLDPSSDPQKSASHTNNGSNGNGSALVVSSYVFPSTGKMARHWAWNIVGPRAIVGSGVRASWNTWVSDRPKEWTKDAKGWAQRFGVAAADNGMNQTSVTLLSMAMHQDPIYYRCSCSELWPRVRHAIEMAFLSRNRSGDRVIAPPKFVSPFVGPMVTRNFVYPRRYNSGDAAIAGATYVAGSVGWNLLREFFLKKTPKW